MTATVIGLGGRLRSGKDAVADYLVAEHGFAKIGMSDALHLAMLALDPVVEAEFGHPAIRYTQAIEAIGYVRTKAQYPEVRRLLQKLGTEVGRDMIGENTWVNITARAIDDHLYADRRVVVTGIRFPQELQMIHAFAGRTVWLDRPSETAAPSAAAHASENGVNADDFDSILLNDGTLEKLYRRVDALL